MKVKICILLFLLSSVCQPSHHRSMFTVLKFKGHNSMCTMNCTQECQGQHPHRVRIINTNKQERSESWVVFYQECAATWWKWSRDNKNKSNIVPANPPPLVSQVCMHGVKECNDNCTERCMCYTDKLVLVKKNKTWEEALDHCRSLGEADTNESDIHHQNRSYDLATLLTKADHAYARERAQNATTDEVWTGLRFLAGHWWWAGGEMVKYEGIKTCPTVRRCGVLEKRGNASFDRRDCEERRNFLCYKRP